MAGSGIPRCAGLSVIERRPPRLTELGCGFRGTQPSARRGGAFMPIEARRCARAVESLRRRASACDAGKYQYPHPDALALLDPWPCLQPDPACLRKVVGGIAVPSPARGDSLTCRRLLDERRVRRPRPTSANAWSWLREWVSERLAWPAPGISPERLRCGCRVPLDSRSGSCVAFVPDEQGLVRHMVFLQADISARDCSISTVCPPCPRHKDRNADLVHVPTGRDGVESFALLTRVSQFSHHAPEGGLSYWSYFLSLICRAQSNTPA